MKEHRLDVAGQDVGSRLDLWLARQMNFSRNKVKELIDGGRVFINNRRVVIAGWELERDDSVLVRMPNEVEIASIDAAAAPPRPRHKRVAPEIRTDKVRHSALRNIGRPTISYTSALAPTPAGAGHGARRKGRAPSRGARGGRQALPQETRLTVYHHDKHLLVVEKPAGLLTTPQGGSEHPHLLTLVHAYLRRKFPQSRHSYLKPLHRLDAETSGILVLATSKEGARLEQQFRDHSIRRRYLAVVCGAIDAEEGTIDAPLKKGDFGHGRKVGVADHDEGRPARTTYHVRERYARATLVEVGVSTGRTHQIRVHMASQGHPLVGDKLYEGGHPEAPSFPRHALHAHLLGFRHPVTGAKLSFTSPLPDDMKGLVDDLRTR